MAAAKLVVVIMLLSTSACGAESISDREIPLDSPIASIAIKRMQDDNSDTKLFDRSDLKAYLIDGKHNKCVWFVYDPRISFNDSEFVYCLDAEKQFLRRL